MVPMTSAPRSSTSETSSLYVSQIGVSQSSPGTTSMSVTGFSTYWSSGTSLRMALSTSGTPCPSQRTSLHSLAIEAAGKLPSAITSVSPCPISHRIERSSGGTGFYPHTRLLEGSLLDGLHPPLLLLSLFAAGLTSRPHYDQHRFGCLTWIPLPATGLDLQPQRISVHIIRKEYLSCQQKNGILSEKYRFCILRTCSPCRLASR